MQSYEINTIIKTITTTVFESSTWMTSSSKQKNSKHRYETETNINSWEETSSNVTKCDININTALIPFFIYCTLLLLLTNYTT